MKRFLLTILLVAACLSADGKALFYQVIPTPEGSSDFVCAYVSPRSYVWAGMSKGLLRYGYNGECRWYYADGGENSLPSDNIINITGDEDGTIWISTDSGMVKYDPEADNFINVDITGFCLFTTSKGETFIGGNNIIYKYDKASNTITDKTNLGFLRSFRVENIFELENGSLILFNKEQGICEFHPLSKHVQFPQANQISDNTAYMMDSQKRIWRSQYNKGVECLDVSGELLKSYTTSNSNLSSNVVTSFLERNGEIWIGTRTGGINILNLETGLITTLSRKKDSFNSFPCNDIAGLYLDAGNSVWAIKSDGSIIILKDSYMRSVSVAPVYNQLGRSSDDVLCFTADKYRSDIVWIGTASSGLYSFNSEKKNSNIELKSWPNTDFDRIESALTLPDGNILLSYRNSGLRIFNPKNGAVTPCKDIKGINVDATDMCYYLGNDPDGRIVLTADRIYFWDFAKGEVIRQSIPAHDGHETICPVSRGEGHYFFCERYLYAFQEGKPKLDKIFDIGEGNTIRSATIDDSGRFWLATGDGLYLFDRGQNSDKAKKVSTEFFTSAETVMADNTGRIWVATSSAVYVYLPHLNNFMKFSDNDGVNWNKYYGKSWFYRSNYLLFGGSNGFLAVDPSLTFQLTDKTEICVSDVILNGERLNGSPKSLFLNSTYRTLRINLLPKENNLLRSKQFRFILQKRNHCDTTTTESASVLYTNLDSGRYKVLASCTLPDGQWSYPIELISLRVSPVWYKSAWFWILILGVILIALFFVLRSIRRDTRNKMSLQVAEHDAQVSQDSLKFLLNVSHELKTPLTLILSPLSRILKNKDKEDPEYVPLTNIYRQANRMSRLILTVLDAHKIQEGSATLNPEFAELNTWVETMAADFDDEAESHSITIKRDYDNSVGRVVIDSNKLENVITNMLINALKHSKNGTTITVGTRKLPDEGMVRVFVADQGDGLHGIDMTKLFSRFYQGYAQKSGSGLGLAYANSIVELHKGTMGAKENADGGATFYFDLPASENTDNN